MAGILKGRKLKILERAQLRPTTDRVREAVFSTLVSLGVVEDANVLDLFAGSGALGIEALSRGAEECHFVESDKRTKEQLVSTLADFGLSPTTRVHLRTIEAFFGNAQNFVDGQLFDLIFCDPPYKHPVAHGAAAIAQSIIESAITNEHAMLVYEGDKSLLKAGWRDTDRYILEKEKQYGNTWIAYINLNVTREVSTT